MVRQLQRVQWKEIPGYNGLYFLSEFGNVLNSKKNKLLTPNKQKGKALYITLCYNGNAIRTTINKLIELTYGNT